MEALFAELKNQIGLRRLRLRRLKFVREQFFLAAAAQNIKRLVSLSQPTDNTCFASYHVVEVRKINSARPCSPLKNVVPNARKARKLAAQCREKAVKVVLEMDSIIKDRL